MSSLRAAYFETKVFCGRELDEGGLIAKIARHSKYTCCLIFFSLKNLISLLYKFLLNIQNKRERDKIFIIITVS